MFQREFHMKRRGFTLVELLVVIGIIALLIAILLPALAKAREQAKSLKCKAQLRQIAIGLVNYSSSNQGSLPSWSSWHAYPDGSFGNPLDDAPGEGWTEMLIPYIAATPDSPVYNCPSFPEEFRINYFLAARWLAVHSPMLRSMKLSSISRQSEFVLSGDCTQPNLYPPAYGTALGRVTDDCDKDDASQEGILFRNSSGGLNVHPGGNNVLFADSHVEIFKAFDPMRMTYHPTQMKAWADVTPGQ
jgi:prepilin-type N-terminal cleavage/methylation domain-containing protein/prepilin-type processing-associated H-X9-DG protein